MWNLKKKKDTNELIYKTEVDSETLKTNLRLPKGKGGKEGWIGGWDWHMHTERYTEWMVKGDLLDSTGNSTQYSIRELYPVSYNSTQYPIRENNVKRMDVCTCI